MSSSQIQSSGGNQLFQPQAPATSALVQIESSRAVQEVQAALIIAKKFPRDQVAAMDRIKNACSRPTLANVAVYQYARGGTDITGPSIRLAEAIAQQWGNLNFGFTELEQGDGASTCEAYCWDLETNTKRSVTFQVPHVRYTKSSGNKALTDPRDIYELVANNASRRVRACILATIPGDVVEAALDQCDETMRATADTSEKAQKLILATFEKYGVSKEQIEKRIQRRLDAIQPAQVLSLRKIAASLKDGMSNPDEWFDIEVASAEQSKILTKPAAAAEKTATAPQNEILIDVPAKLYIEQVHDLIKETKLSWRVASEILSRNQVITEAYAAPEDASDAELQEVVHFWPSVVKLAQEKGGAK